MSNVHRLKNHTTLVQRLRDHADATANELELEAAWRIELLEKALNVIDRDKLCPDWVRHIIHKSLRRNENGSIA